MDNQRGQDNEDEPFPLGGVEGGLPMWSIGGISVGDEGQVLGPDGGCPAGQEAKHRGGSNSASCS